jgi:glutaredoxin
VQAKKLLESHNIKYTDINIEEDMIAKDFIIQKGHKSVPQFYVGDNILVEGGFTGLRGMARTAIESKVAELI